MKIVAALSFCVIITLFTGCGFKLSTDKLSNTIPTLKSINSNYTTTFISVLNKSVRNQGISITPTSKYSLYILNEKYSESILSTSSRSIVRQKIITLAVQYQLRKNTKLFIEPTWLKDGVIIFNNSVNVLNFEQEKEEQMAKLQMMLAKMVLSDIEFKLSQAK